MSLKSVTAMSALLILSGVLIVPAALADGKCGDDAAQMQELAKRSQNPVADLISAPFENNINYNAGPRNKTDNILTFKPVYPVAISEDWNLINRFLVPIVSRAGRSPGEGREVGLGDITYQGFFSPRKVGKAVWGIGPTFVARTGTGDLSADQWSIGPSAVVLMTPGKWVVGALVSNVWSFAGDSGARNVSQGSLQYYVNYNMDGGWYLTMVPTILANWKAKNDQTWTVPVGGGLGRVFRFGEQAINARLAAYYNVERPNKTSDWQLSAQVTFLFPE
jgi:hypothetical protein